MILTIDHDSFKGDSLEGTSFKRLYAPNSPHTIGSESRTCVSCHANPSALGYGKGKLELDVTETNTRWSFQPEYAENAHDGLPEDADRHARSGGDRPGQRGKSRELATDSARSLHRLVLDPARRGGGPDQPAWR